MLGEGEAYFLDLGQPQAWLEANVWQAHAIQGLKARNLMSQQREPVQFRAETVFIPNPWALMKPFSTIVYEAL